MFNNSLFEDFCEFGLGMALGNKKMKERVAKLLTEASEANAPDEFITLQTSGLLPATMPTRQARLLQLRAHDRSSAAAGA